MWTPYAWMRAECGIFGRAFGTNFSSATDTRHDAPAIGCSCGIYAAKDLAGLAARGFVVDCARGLSVMVGIVELAGTIIEHDFGYRAEYVRVVALLPAPGHESVAAWIGAVYGVPVSSQLIDRWDDLPHPAPSAMARIPPLVRTIVTPAPRPDTTP